MKFSIGTVLWLALSLEITAIYVAKPEITTEWWMLIVSGLCVQAWLAWHNSIYGLTRKTRHGTWKVTMELNHFIANIFVFFAILLGRIFRKTAGKFKKTKTEIVTTHAARVADKSIRAHVVHPRLIHSATRVLLGYNKKKRPIIVDLSDMHTLIGSSTNGGKTTLIRSLLIQILAKPDSIRPQVYIVDLKSNVEDGLNRFSTIFEYISSEAEAVNLFIRLDTLVGQRNRGETPRDRPVLLFIDEIADLTANTTDTSLRRASISLLTLLARKARSANVYLIVSTQHPRYDTLPKSICNNLMRKIALPVASRMQMEVVLEYKPTVAMPSRAGDFLVREGLRLKRGRTLRSSLAEVDAALMAQIDTWDGPLFTFYKAIAGGRQKGDSVPGQSRAYDENRTQEWCTQPFVRDAYKRFIKSGILSEPRRGSASRLLVPFIEGIHTLKKEDGNSPNAKL